MKGIFRLAISEWFHSKTWLVLIALIAAAAFAAPAIVPYQIDPSLAAPARGQVAYAVLFILVALYGPAVAAEMGRAQVRNNHRLFWRAQGVSDLRYYSALLTAAAIPVAILCGSGAVIIRLAGAGELSTAALAQAMALTAMAGMVVLPLALGLSQRAAATVGGLFAIGLNLIGYYGPGILDFVHGNRQLSHGAVAAAEVVSALIPHLRLGDQAERITFAWSAIPVNWFLGSCVYLAFCGAVMAVIGFGLFQKRTV